MAQFTLGDCVLAKIRKKKLSSIGTGRSPRYISKCKEDSAEQSAQDAPFGVEKRGEKKKNVYIHI